MSNPLISVVIPTFNNGEYLQEAVGSVVNQTLSTEHGIELDILILDDGSSDDTSSIIKELSTRHQQVRCVSNQENTGVAETRNRGFELAKGEYIALLDADDIWMKNKLERQLSLMESRNLDVCYTGYSLIDSQGVQFGKPYHVPENLSYRRLVNENVIGCSTVLLRKSAVQGLRMRSEYPCEDYVFWLELMQGGRRFGGIEDCLSLYRVTKGSLSGNKRKAAMNRWIVYRDFLKMNSISATVSFVFYATRGYKKYYL